MFVALGLVLILVVLATQSFSQDDPPQRGRRGGQGGPAQGQMAEPGQRNRMANRDPEEMRKMMMERMTERVKRALNPTEEEWTKIQPALEKVLTLRQETEGMGPMGRMGRGRGPMAGGPEGADQPQSKIEKARMELRTALDETDKDAVKTKLEAFRTARDEADKELAAAKKELKGTVTLPQEAELVLMGYLD